jgi:Protein of unknown function (DUF4229)
VTPVSIPPATKYTLGRIGLFAACFLILVPFRFSHDSSTSLLVKLMIAAIVSAVASWFLLAKWRDEMAGTIERSMSRRQAEKEKLRSALAGDEDSSK